MSFIIRNDLNNTLNNTDVSTLTSNDNVLTNIITRAIEEVKSYIQHRYDVDLIFIDVNTYSAATTYAIDDLVYYTETAYSAATTYDASDRISYLGNIYNSLQGTNLGQNPVTETAYWEFVTEDKVYYTCTAESTGNYPDDTDYFSKSDSRDQSIIDITCIITLFYLFRKVTPRTPPEWIVSEYDRVRDDLKAYQRGTRTIILPVKVDADGEDEGERVVYGSETQKDWDF